MRVVRSDGGAGSVSPELLAQIVKEPDHPIERDRVQEVPRDHPGEIVNLAADPVPEEPLRIQRLVRPFLVALHVRLTGRRQEVGRVLFRVDEALAKERDVMFQERHQLRHFQIGIGAHRRIEIDDHRALIVLEDMRAAEIAVTEGISVGIDPWHMRDQQFADVFEERRLCRTEERNPLDPRIEAVHEGANVPGWHMPDVEGVNIPMDSSDGTEYIARSVRLEANGQRFGRPCLLEEDARVAATAPRGSAEQKVGDFYAACMNETAIEAAGMTPIQDELSRINAISDRASLLTELTRLHNEGYGPLFRVSGQNDMKNSKMIIASVGSGGLGLPDRDYYLRDQDRFKTREHNYQHKDRV